jgi:hypothetical protein
MEPHGEHLREHALALASVAEQLAESAADRTGAVDLPAALASVEQALGALSRTYEEAARSLVPSGDPFESSSFRFARAARAWPTAVGPSHERQAELLSALHAAAASLRAARHACAYGRTAVEKAMGQPGRAQAPAAAAA